MQLQFLLLFGIASVAATVGYMAGGSATPVASIAIPAVFGLVVTALGLLQAPQPSKELLEYLKSAGEKADSQQDIVEYRKRTKSAPSRIGLALVVFSCAYLAAATFGAKVRIDNLLVPKKDAREFPWAKSDTKPPTINAALEWMALQARLHDLGYDESRIATLYAIQVAEWKSTSSKIPAAVNAPAKDEGAPKIGLAKPIESEDILQDWLKQGAVKGNPFANQPHKDLIDKLKNIDVPGKPGNAMPG